MPQSNYDKINQQIDIVSHISKFEELTQEGNRYSGTHNHNSKGGRCLQITQSEGLWHCFSCNQGGGAIQYEKDRLNTDYDSAIQSLADQYNIKIPGQTLEEQEQRKREYTERFPVQQLMTEAFKLYHENMTDEQRNYFKSRGISDETINENLLGYAPPDNRWLVEKLYEKTGVKDVNQMLATGLFFQNNGSKIADRYQDRYIFPYWYRGNPVFSIGRSINPDMESYKKYVKHLVKSDKYNFVSDLAVKHILWGEDTIKPRDSILVAEGIVDAILAKQHFSDKFTILSPVTTSWTNAQIERLALPTGKVKEIIFVADADSSKAGEKGAINTAKKLLKAWKKIAKDNPGAFFSRPNPESGESEPYFPKIKIARLRRPPEKSTIDLADYIQDKQIQELEYWIEAAKGLEYEENRIENNPRRFFSNIKHASYIPKRMADEICLDNEYFIWTAEQMYRYEKGVYRSTGENYIDQETQRRLSEMSTRQREKETVNFLKTKYRKETDDIHNDKYILNLRNGLFNIRTLKLKPHTPYCYSVTRIPIVYNPEAAYKFDNQGVANLTEAAREIQRFITAIVPLDCIDLIYEMAGYCLYTDTNYERNFMLIGEGANGKSTLLKLIKAMLGKENTAAIPLQELDQNRFKRAEIFGKLANLFADISASEIKSSSYLKMIASGDEMDGERKNKDPFFFTPHSKLIFSANELPRTKDRTHGFYRKWALIPFPNKFEGNSKDVDLINELASEDKLSAFFNLSIEGINRVFSNSDFSSSDSTREQMEKYKEANDSVYAFIEEAVIEDMGNFVKRQELYQTYNQWCEDGGNRPVSQIKFNQQLPQHIPSAIKARDTESISRDQIWRNVGFV